MRKIVSITLFRPDGGTAKEYFDVEITSQSPEEITFRQARVAVNGTVTTVFTSNLKYLIVEETVL